MLLLRIWIYHLEIQVCTLLIFINLSNEVLKQKNMFCVGSDRNVMAFDCLIISLQSLHHRHQSAFSSRQRKDYQ